jgi:two-component system invasion response regulator UvrY
VNDSFVAAADPVARVPIRIGIADDHPVVRTALRHWLLEHSDLCIAGEAADGFEALELATRNTLDVLVLDLTMPGRDGFDIIGSLRSKAPGMAILVFSGHPEAQYARKLLEEGAHGYLHKSCDPDQLIVAIRRVASGRRYLSATLAQHFARELCEGALPLHQRLSKREFQILLLLAAGDKPAVIAKKLHLSARTVTLYRSRLVRKLELSTNSDLTYFALKHGLLD